jgi:enoyl-CoA hydratase/carnithine racemase
MKKLRITRHSPAYWRATFDNPPLNLLDLEVAYELRELINQMETSKELKVIVFDSADTDFYIGHVDIVRAGEFPTAVDPYCVNDDSSNLFSMYTLSSHYFVYCLEC